MKPGKSNQAETFSRKQTGSVGTRTGERVGECKTGRGESMLYAAKKRKRESNSRGKGANTGEVWKKVKAAGKVHMQVTYTEQVAWREGMGCNQQQKADTGPQAESDAR